MNNKYNDDNDNKECGQRKCSMNKRYQIKKKSIPKQELNRAITLDGNMKETKKEMVTLQLGYQ